MQREVDSGPYLVQSKAVRNQLFHRQQTAKHQIGRFLLQIHRGAVRSKDHALAHADIGAGNLNPLMV
jgi:hypothetical protein